MRFAYYWMIGGQRSVESRGDEFMLVKDGDAEAGWRMEACDMMM
jgi:hypothetical protein